MHLKIRTETKHLIQFKFDNLNAFALGQIALKGKNPLPKLLKHPVINLS